MSKSPVERLLSACMAVEKAQVEEQKIRVQGFALVCAAMFVGFSAALLQWVWKYSMTASLPLQFLLMFYVGRLEVRKRRAIGKTNDLYTKRIEELRIARRDETAMLGMGRPFLDN